MARSQADAADDPGRDPCAVGCVLSRRAIVHVVEALGGGVFEVVRALANHTAERGFPTVVIYGRRPETPEDVQAHFHARVRTVEVPGWGMRSIRDSVAAAFRAAKVIRGELAAHPGGVLHLHSSYAGIVGRLIAPRREWKLFYSPHAYAFLNAALPGSARRLARASEVALGRRGTTIAVSGAEGTVAGRIVGPSRVVVVPNGVDLPPLSEPTPPEPPFLVASVGRASFQRRPDMFAEIASMIGHELGTEFIWFGDGRERARLVAAGVDVRGWLPRREAHAAIEQVHVVLHLTAFEGLPLALLEAMARSRPIIATDLAPVRETLGDAGLLVRSSHEACAALRRLHGDPSLRLTLGRQARARVEQLFTRERMQERMLSVYGLRDD